MDVLKNYNRILDSTNPDKHIEHFWYGFKNSIHNFFIVNNLKEVLPVEKWSEKLNDLQKECKYDEIEENIRNYMEKFGYYVIKYGDLHYGNIFHSNIKRWNKISKNFEWDYNKEKSIYTSFLKIFFSAIKRKKTNVLKKIREYSASDTNNIIILYDILLDAIEEKDVSIIDFIGECCGIWSFINENFDIEVEVKRGMCGKKILWFIKS